MYTSDCTNKRFKVLFGSVKGLLSVSHMVVDWPDLMQLESVTVAACLSCSAVALHIAVQQAAEVHH